MKNHISVQIPFIPQHSYNVFIGRNFLENLQSIIPATLKNHQFIIVTDHRVKRLYGDRVGKNIDIIAFPAGENHKTAKTKANIEDALFKRNLGRDTCLIALGGGVVGDMVGFVAANYMRGIPYIQVPTTLLAMIDSSIGGKTSINSPAGKNLIGAFWHPKCVITDLNCLDTLPQKHIINGWIEALKIFLTCDRIAFQQSKQCQSPPLELITKAIQLKSNIVQQDPDEKNIRAVLNFGHTIGHALEKISDYTLLHGHAVGYGILVESHIAMQRQLLTNIEYQDIVDTFASLGILGKKLKKYNINTVLKYTRHDKKNQNNETRYVLLRNIGNTYVSNGKYTHAIQDDEVKTAYTSVIEGLSHGR